MSFNYKYNTKNDFLPIKTLRRSGIKNNGVRFVVVHDTGNPNSTAQNNVNYYKNSANAMSASAHVFIDDKDIIICVPLNEKAWHVIYDVTTDNKIFGGDANDIAIGVELCFFPNDKARTLKAYQKYVWFNAWLAYNYKLNPKSSFVGHHILDPKRKVDPTTALKIIGKTYNDLLNDIVKEYNECTNAKPVTPPKEEPKMKELFVPSSNTIKECVVSVLRKMENTKLDDGSQALLDKWRIMFLNGQMTESDALGIIFVAIDRGFIKKA